MRDICDELADNARMEWEIEMAETPNNVLAATAERCERERRERMESESARSVGVQFNASHEQAASIPTEPVPSVRDMILGNVREAGQLLTKANAAAFSRNPMSAEVPAFQELTTIAKRLNSLMQEIAKVRGL